MASRGFRGRAVGKRSEGCSRELCEASGDNGMETDLSKTPTCDHLPCPAFFDSPLVWDWAAHPLRLSQAALQS
eukprot:1343407-Prymnesium_polylepis.1